MSWTQLFSNPATTRTRPKKAAWDTSAFGYFMAVRKELAKHHPPIRFGARYHRDDVGYWTDSRINAFIEDVKAFDKNWNTDTWKDYREHVHPEVTAQIIFSAEQDRNYMKRLISRGATLELPAGHEGSPR